MEHLSTAVRFITDNLQTIVRQFIETEDAERRERLHKTITPVLPGVTLVLGCSLLERSILDIMAKTDDSGHSLDPSLPAAGGINEWQRYLDLDPDWYGWSELANFFRLRHCFAHEFGRLTDRQERDIKSFMRDLDEGRILTEDNQVVHQYINIDGEKISLTADWISRFRIILAHFLRLLDARGLLVFQK